MAWCWHTTHNLCFTIVEKWSHPLITAIALASCCSTQALEQVCTVTFDICPNKNWPNYLCTFKDRYLEMRFLHTYMALFVWKVFCSSSTIMKPESETNLITYHSNALTPHMTRQKTKWALNRYINISSNGDAIKWKHFLRYWLFVRGIHQSPVNFLQKDQWRWALMFSLIYAWINGWVNNSEAGDLRRHHGQ